MQNERWSGMKTTTSTTDLQSAAQTLLALMQLRAGQENTEHTPLSPGELSTLRDIQAINARLLQRQIGEAFQHVLVAKKDLSTCLDAVYDSFNATTSLSAGVKLFPRQTATLPGEIDAVAMTESMAAYIDLRLNRILSILDSAVDRADNESLLQNGGEQS